MGDQARLFKALGDKSRLRILRMLQIRPLCVCEIREILGLATSTVSQHLAILRTAGFIYDIKDQKWVEYHLNPGGGERKVRAILEVLGSADFDNEVYRDDAQRVQTVDRNRLCGV